MKKNFMLYIDITNETIFKLNYYKFYNNSNKKMRSKVIITHEINITNFYLKSLSVKKKNSYAICGADKRSIYERQKLFQMS